MSISALQNGVAGIQTGLTNLKKDASQIAQASTRDGGTQAMTDPLVNLKADEIQVAASSKVVKTVSDLLGQFLDIKA